MVQAARWTTSYRVPNTLASDTEESVVGTQWHQEASFQLAEMLRAVSDRHGASWGVCEGISLLGLRHEDGTSYDPKPDVMVLRQPLESGSMGSVRVDHVGAPLFIAELASDSTKGNDQGDKKQAYAAIGVAEYVVFDPDGNLLPDPFVAWRLRESVYMPWEPDIDGWWNSAVLGAAFQPGHPFVRVRDRDGIELVPAGVMRQQMREMERRLAEEERRRAALDDLVRRYRDRFGPLDPEP